MAKHTLFLVHGMGSYVGKPWASEVWAKVVECSELYPHFEDAPLESYAQYVPIQYDDLLVKRLESWDRQAESFAAFAGRNALPGADSLDWLSGVSGAEAGFVLTHIVDVVIARFFPYEGAQIRTKVVHDIFAKILAERSSDSQARFSVMAHSLGTAVSHDALAEIASAPKIEGNENAYSAQNFKFESIHMLANVSRVLQTSPKVYESFVRPGAANAKDRYCLSMYSHRHALDPFTRPKPFQPVGWGPRFAQSPDLSHYRGWDVHGWLHYLDHPRVHIPLLRSLSKPSAITPKQEKDAENAYPQFGGDLANLAQAKAKLAELHALIGRIELDQGLAENFKTLKKCLETLKELRDIAGDTWRTLEGSFA